MEGNKMATTKIEKYTEKLTEQEMKISAYGENDYHFKARFEHYFSNRV